MFCGLDSDLYPLKSYGDVAYRVFGPWARHCVNILQSIQLIFNVGILILSNGQSISQMSKGSICFIVCLVIFLVAGMVVGQIRTLARFGWLANAAVWLNVLNMFFIMGVAANSLPNYAAVQASYGIAPGPVHRSAGQPAGTNFVDALNGLNQAVYSFGGAMIFVEFMAEMRHPMDFWKALIIATCFIYFVYMFFGLFVYSYQGQYAFNPAMQGLSPYAWQTVGNVLNVITGLIAACLYGNIGLKVLYVSVLEEFFHAPSLIKKAGKILWVGLLPMYWALAFVIAAAIPQFSYLSGLIGALCILQFTYTFPPILYLGYQIKKDAMLPSEQMDAHGQYIREDTGMTRWIRGYKRRWLMNSFNVFYALGAATTAVLGIYSSIKSLIDAFNGTSVATSFGCAAPV
jgi:hypothetical protein